MKKIITLLSIVLAFGLIAKAQLVVPECSAPPVIDGYADSSDPWGDTWIDLAEEKDNGDAATHDMSAKFQVAHDADNIYIVIVAQDATPNNDATAIPNTYQRDCSEIFFSMHSASGDSPEAYVTDEGDWQIRVQRASDTDAFIDGSGNVAAVEWEFAVVDDGASEYTTEMTFPIATLKENGNFNGVDFRFECQVADNTTGTPEGRTQQMFWKNASDSQWNDLSTFSAAKLEGGVLISAKETAKVVGSAHLYQNNLYVKNVTGEVSVFDVTGKLVRSENVLGNATIDVSDLKSGLYIVKNNDFSVKVIK
jgi:hypothetical protein